MAGSSNGFSPEPGGIRPQPVIKLCHQTGVVPDKAPGWLGPHELKRFTGLSGERAAEFLTSRWLIRQTLSQATQVAPEHCQPVEGHPTAAANPPGWRLSLSHSHGLTACSTLRSLALGIDIEPGKRHPQWEKVVKRWFSPIEQEWLFQDQDPHNFLRVWTLKEAWLKATGRGIAGNLQTLEVRRNFELYGDQPDNHWFACCFYIEGFVSTLVYQRPAGERTTPWPEITLLEPPPEDYSLIDAEPLETHWEPLFQRRIYPKGSVTAA